MGSEMCIRDSIYTHIYIYTNNEVLIAAFPPDNCRREFHIVGLPIDNRGKPREKKKN